MVQLPVPVGVLIYEQKVVLAGVAPLLTHYILVFIALEQSCKKPPGYKPGYPWAQ